MIASLVPQLPDILVGILALAISFVAGVAWAAYRALSWVERVNAWAHSCEIDQELQHESSTFLVPPIEGGLP